MFDIFDNPEFRGVPISTWIRTDMSWEKDDKGYRVIVDHAGIGEVDVAIDEDCVCVTGSAEVFGDKRTITKTFYLPCKQSEIEQIAYQTINGVTMIRIFTQQQKERKIPINKI